MKSLPYDKIKWDLKELEIPFREGISLKPISSFKIGGVAPILVEPEREDHIEQIFQYSSKTNTPVRILGGASNLLISENLNDFLIIRLSGDFKNMKMISEDGIFQIGAATNTTPTFRKISESGYRGVEFLSTIPGWTGGAVIQNAGCYGGELFDFIDTVTYFSITKSSIYTKAKSELEFGYRSTQFLKSKDSLILSIQMTIPRGSLEEIEVSLKEKRDKRNASQPANKKSAGSVFKNPLLKDSDGNPIKAWKLIDEAGLRGMVRGNAQISPEHCNFIVNLGDAVSSDVAYLSKLVQEQVYNKSGIHLEREIEFFGSIS